MVLFAVDRDAARIHVHGTSVKGPDTR
jgi:hypothetical protein